MYEDSDGNVPDYGNHALDKIRRLNKNIISQIWNGHRKLPEGVLAKDFGNKHVISEKDPTYLKNRKKTDAEIKA